MSAWVRDLAVQWKAVLEKIEEWRGLERGLGLAFPIWQSSGRDAILRPPKPQLTPSAGIIQLVQDRDTEPEAAD